MLVGDLVYNDYFDCDCNYRVYDCTAEDTHMTKVRNVSMMQSEMATGNPLTRSLICRFCI